MSLREVTRSMLDEPVKESEMPALMTAVEELIFVWGDLYERFVVTDAASSAYQVKGVHFKLHDRDDEIVATNGSAVLYEGSDHTIHVRVGYLGVTFKAFGLNNTGENVVTFFDGRVEIAHGKVVYTFDGTLSLRVNGIPIADINNWILKQKDDVVCACCPNKSNGGCYTERGYFSLVAAT